MSGIVFWSAPLRAARFCGRRSLPFLHLRLALHGLRIFPFRCWMWLGWRRGARRLLLIPFPLGALDWYFLGVVALRILAWQIGGRTLGWFAL